MKTRTKTSFLALALVILVVCIFALYTSSARKPIGEDYVATMIEFANDDSHGYYDASFSGDRKYDVNCATLIYWALWTNGYNVNEYHADDVWNNFMTYKRMQGQILWLFSDPQKILRAALFATTIHDNFTG